MGRGARVSGMGLMIAGIAGAAFFLLTDPKVGWLKSRISDNLIDAARTGSIGTYVGLAGSMLVVVIGLWLVTRRSG
jgi:hypothetical protein